MRTSYSKILVFSIIVFSSTILGCSSTKTAKDHNAHYSNLARMHDRRAEEFRKLGDEQAAKQQDKLADDARKNYFRTSNGLTEIIVDSVIDNAIDAIFK